MILDKAMLSQLEQSQMKVFDENFKRYLLTAYGQEPFPYVYSEQDLFEHIRKDFRAYESGQLDVSVMDSAKHWEIERTELQNLYAQKANEIHELTAYANELEQILRSNNLESSGMAKKRLEEVQENDF